MGLPLPPTAAPRFVICHQVKALQDSQLELPVEEQQELASVRLALPVLQLKMECETWVFLAWDLPHDGYPHTGVREVCFRENAFPS